MTPYALDHPLVREYLHRLERATAALAPDERADINDGIRSHLLEALADAETDADVANTLNALGDPDEIVGVQPQPGSTTGRGVFEIVAVVFLLIGAFIVPGVGWIVGVVLLWVSKAWTTGQKVIGTLVLPGGLAAPVLAWLFPITTETCTQTSSGDFDNLMVCTSGAPPLWVVVPLFAILAIAPVVTAIYLLRTAARETG
jgi:hypothetical protein